MRDIFFKEYSFPIDYGYYWIVRAVGRLASRGLAKKHDYLKTLPPQRRREDSGIDNEKENSRLESSPYLVIEIE